MLPPRAAVAEALVRFSLGAGPACWRRRRCTVHCRRSSRSPGGWPTRGPRWSRPPRPRSGSTRCWPRCRTSARSGPPGRSRSTARRGRRPDDPRLVLATEELRLEGDEALDVRLVPVRYRDVPGPRYAGQAASGMPLQEAILRMTVDTEQSQDADTDGFTERSLQAERGGVDVTATERPPEPLPHDHGPDLDDHHEHAHGHLHAARPGRVRLPRVGPPRRPLPRRLVPGPAGQPEAGPVRPAAPARAEPARSPAARAGLPAGAGPPGRPDARAAPAVRGRSRPGRLRGRDRRPAHRGAALAARLRGAAGGAPGRRGRAGDRPQLVHRRAAAAGPAPADAGGADPRPAAGRGQPAGRGAGAGRRRLRHLRLLRRRPGRRAAVGGQGPRRAADAGDAAPAGGADAGPHHPDGPGDPAPHRPAGRAARPRPRCCWWSPTAARTTSTTASSTATRPCSTTRSPTPHGRWPRPATAASGRTW